MFPLETRCGLHVFPDTKFRNSGPNLHAYINSSRITMNSRTKQRERNETEIANLERVPCYSVVRFLRLSNQIVSSAFLFLENKYINFSVTDFIAGSLTYTFQLKGFHN